MRNGMRPVHPGEVLREEFMEPMGLSASAVARALKVPPKRISALVHQQRGVTAETAIRLGLGFGTTPEFWMNLQVAYELRSEELSGAKRIAAEVSPLIAAR